MLERCQVYAEISEKKERFVKTKVEMLWGWDGVDIMKEELNECIFCIRQLKVKGKGKVAPVLT
jgi:hypothetical protein